MKYQNFAIIFVIIILPISMVLSYYIQMQTDTLTLQTNYQTKLDDSTYDAVAAYQMNSLNTQRMAGESVKSYVLASVNTFFTTLATNLGMSSASKQYLLPYIPAILFTTYDGYYIYSPVKGPMIAEDPYTGIAMQTEREEVLYISDSAPKNFDETIRETWNMTVTEEQNTTNLNNFIADNLGRGWLTADPAQARIDYNYMLKPFIYYSAQYKEPERVNPRYDFVASYSLDNYVTLYGKRNTELSTFENESSIEGNTPEFSKSGYLIDTSKITLSGNLLVKGITREDEQSTSEPSRNGRVTHSAIVEANSGGSSVTSNHVRYKPVDVTSTEAYYFINYYAYGKDTAFGGGYYPGRIRSRDVESLRCQTGDEIIKETLEIENEINSGELMETQVASALQAGGHYDRLTVEYNGIAIDDTEAKEYYVKAYFFTRWVQNNLSSIEARSVVQSDDIIRTITGSEKDEYVNFDGDTTRIFDMSTVDNNPESTTSFFSEHKRNVIKNSIQFNLNTAISTYDEEYFGGEVRGQFQLPILTVNDWEKILNNISMTSFMQGIRCGTTTFNNYSVVRSSNNNTAVSLENVYFTNEIGREHQSNSYYHQYDCPELYDGNGNATYSDYYESDLSAEFKYDAKSINMRLTSTDDDAEVVCLYDDSTNTYYKIDEGKSFSNTDVLAVGEKIENLDILSYSGNTYRKVDGRWVSHGSVSNIDITLLPNASEVIYLYDHQNLGCYDCIISSNYQPVVKYFNGDVRSLYQTTDNQVLIMVEDGGSTKYYYQDGREYNGTPSGGKNLTAEVTYDELTRRRKSVYTAIAKYRNSIYKTNDYVNR